MLFVIVRCLDLKMTIPAYGVDVTGVEAIWQIRLSMGEAALNPHSVSCFKFLSPNDVEAFAHVHDRSSGELVQISKCQFHFAVTGGAVQCVHYHQENLFLKASSEPDSVEGRERICAKMMTAWELNDIKAYKEVVSSGEYCEW